MSETVRIQAIAAGGDGVGNLADGRAVFVPRAAPGDLVELRQVTLAKRYARARLGRLIEASPDRVDPACPHYTADECGSCQLQHLSPPAQRSVRRQLVGDALRRIGRLEAADPPLEPSESEWGYRAKVTLAVGRTREVIGYHRLGRADTVFDLTRCPIARPELNSLWAAVREHRRLLPRNPDRLVLRVDRSERRHLIVKAGGTVRRRAGTDAWVSAKELGQTLEREGIPAVLWWQPEGGVVRTVFGEREAYPVTVFEQVHPEVGDRIRRYAVEQLGQTAGKHGWDLYAGIGETTAMMQSGSEREGGGVTLESVEVDPRAVRIAGQRGPSAGVRRIVGRVEDVIQRLKPADFVVVNPPRAGLAAAVTTRLAGQPAVRLVYVSCDPATLARDLCRLAPAYRLSDVRAFDLFPQTAHVETVATLERR